MKGREAEIRIRKLEDKILELNIGICIRDCPKCKHPTPQQDGSRYPYPHPSTLYHYQCLVCGSKIVCTTDTICKVVKVKR